MYAHLTYINYGTNLMKQNFNKNRRTFYNHREKLLNGQSKLEKFSRIHHTLWLAQQEHYLKVHLHEMVWYFTRINAIEDKEKGFPVLLFYS
jgi:hypothetical protein